MEPSRQHCPRCGAECIGTRIDRGQSVSGVLHVLQGTLQCAKKRVSANSAANHRAAHQRAAPMLEDSKACVIVRQFSL
jgi:hypothetical protein